MRKLFDVFSSETIGSCVGQVWKGDKAHLASCIADSNLLSRDNYTGKLRIVNTILSKDSKKKIKVLLAMGSFSEWLRVELRHRKWKQADLARAANLDTAVVSNLYNGKRGPGEDTCRAIARAFELPIETVYRAAGLLPPVSEDDALIEQITNDLNRLSEPRRKLVMDFVRFLATQQSTEGGNEEARP